MYLQWLSTLIPLQWLYVVLPTWRLHVMNLLLLFYTLVASLFMLPFAAPCFAFLPKKVWFFATLDNTWSSFFLPSRSLILNLVYLCYFKSPIYDFHSYSILLNPLSNAIGLTQFGFFKRELCPISHNALIMDCFSRVHLYSVPPIIVSSFSSEIDTKKSKFHEISSTLYKIQIQFSERELWWFSQGHLFEMKFRSLSKP